MSQYEVLRRLLSDRPIAFHPHLARILGGVNEALLFQQIAYWSDKGDDPEWIYKTQKDLEEETTLTRTQQEGARKKLRSLGVLEEEKRGLPAKLYYRVNWDAVFALLEASPKDAGNLQSRMQMSPKDAENLRPRMRETRTQVREKAADQPVDYVQPLIGTEKTEEKTDKDPSNHSTGPSTISREETEQITWYAADLAQELGDTAPLKSTASRLTNLYLISGMPLDEFLDTVQQARLRTKRYTGNIRRKEDGSKPKIGYFMSVLQDLISQSAD